MAAIFSSIDPNTTSGTQLATILNDFKDSIVTGFMSNAARPANLQAGGYWIDNANDPLWDYKLYTGTADYTVWTINKNTGAITLQNAASTFRIIRDSDDAAAALLELKKSRLTGDQVQANDFIGQVDFIGTDDGNNDVVQARLVAKSVDNVTAANQGADVSLFTTKQGTSALVEVLTVKNDGSVGIGVTSPQRKLDIFANDNTAEAQVKRSSDDAVNPKIKVSKRRISNNGQVLNGDVIGEYQFLSTDDVGTEQVVANIKVAASETHTAANRGVTLTIQAMKDGESVLTDILTIENGLINGTEKATAAMQDDSATRTLYTVSSANHKAFSGEVFFDAEDGLVRRGNRVSYWGQWDSIAGAWKFNQSNAIDADSDSDLAAANVSFSDVGGVLSINYTETFGSGTFNAGTLRKKIERYDA